MPPRQSEQRPERLVGRLSPAGLALLVLPIREARQTRAVSNSFLTQPVTNVGFVDVHAQLRHAGRSPLVEDDLSPGYTTRPGFRAASPVTAQLVCHNLRGDTKQSLSTGLLLAASTCTCAATEDHRVDDRHVAPVHVGPDCRDVVSIPPQLSWWRIGAGCPPDDWVEAFEALTTDDAVDDWGLAAAIFIARTRRRSGRGPTFRELFRALLPEWDGVPSRLPPELNYAARKRVIKDFRLQAAIVWKRAGWINWDPGIARSLRVGRRFREQSRHHQATHRQSSPPSNAREAQGEPPGDHAQYPRCAET